MFRLCLLFFCIFESIFCQIALGPSYGPVNVLSNVAANGIAANSVTANNLAYGDLANNMALNNPIGSIAGNTAENPLNGVTLAGTPISAASPFGYDDIVVGGELPVTGSTAVAGNVPVIGFVTFEGIVPASGMVSLASDCGYNNQPVY